MFSLDIKTVFVMVIMISFSLALAIGWIAKDDRDGLRSFALALCAHGVGYMLLAMRGAIADWISIIVANTIIGLSHSLFLLAVSRFREMRCPASWLLAPPVLVAIGFAFSMDNIQHRIVIANGIFAAQNLLINYRLLAARFDSPIRGRNLMACGISVIILMLITRCYAAIVHPDSLNGAFQSSTVQRVTYLLVFVVIVLVTIGFLMMTKERSDARLLNTALRDHLTGCWNRIYLEEVVAREIAQLQRNGHPATVILFDLDHFKKINDHYGHDGGDRVLREFTRVLAPQLRDTDILGRWGGEEFLAILPMTGLTEALAIAERLRQHVAAHPFAIGRTVTVSVGVAACLSTDSWAEWFQRADTALYHAKESGRNQVCADGIAFTQRPGAMEKSWVYQLVWRDAYLCGDAQIDEQHRNLFVSANRLLALDNQQHAGVIAAMLEFIDMVRHHFTDEEALLKQLDLEMAQLHGNIHRNLLERADHLLSQYRSSHIDVAAIFHFVIHELFTQHILLDDHKFTENLQRHLVNASSPTVMSSAQD
jgi:diguanylate cyclase (GGDEF)-like protein/hemerythrin-like metal-binding protein